MGFSNESSVRSLLNEGAKARQNVAKEAAEFLKRQIEEKGMLNVGAGVETELGNISRGRLDQALYMLELEGYPVYVRGVPQATNPGQQTNIKVICPKGTEYKDVYDTEKIHSITDYITYDGGDSFKKAFEYPSNMDISRLEINYKETGGAEKDGLIELRRGVDDLSLGNSHYAQVRIRVDGDRYLKGMAVYADDLPDGIDVRFNTNKSQSVPPRDVLKKISSDPTNPFGSLIKDKEKGGQYYYIGEDGKEHLGLINKRADESDWGEWSKTLPSQFLSKQNIDLIKKQLNLSVADYESDLDDIMRLENPTIKRYLLEDFAQTVDKAAVHLKAASLPNTQYQVILPVPSLGDDEVFAPNYKEGERVALVRYPHGGTFEIPICKVNNKNPEASRMITREANDAIGINSKVAQILSGADFDGDTVMVIPLRNGLKITSTPPLAGLKDFDPKLEYGGKPEGTFKLMKEEEKQRQMGKVSNLITDMTIKGAPPEDIEKAVRHSMVVIDAVKHKLDYKQSERDNDIQLLKNKWQDGGGASTLLSLAKSPYRVSKRTGQPWIDPDTGELIWTRVDPKTGEIETKIHPEFYTNKAGKLVERTITTTRMAETKDAFTLSSGTKVESYYAQYANTLKALANKARKEAVHTKDIKYDPSAKKAYSTEVSELLAQLKTSIANKPREQTAQIRTNAILKKKRAADPDLTKKEIKKLSQIILNEERQKVGAKRNRFSITEKQWKAIQSGAISPNVLKQLINFADKTELKSLAMPKTRQPLSQFKVNKAKAMLLSGHTRAEIAEALGVSVSTVSKYLKGDSQ